MVIYVAATVAEINDHLGAMVLCMPEYPMPGDGIGMDESYAELEDGLGIVRAKIGEIKYEKLILMARQSKQFFVDGKDKEGRFLLQDMQKLLIKGLKAGLEDYE